MLLPGVNSFGWQVDSLGATLNNTTPGVSVTANASAHTKTTTPVNLLNGIAEDCYFLQVCFLGGDSSGNIRRFLADIRIDPAAGAGNAGSSWTTLIANLAANSPTLIAGGYWYGFPIFIPKGTAIGAAVQCSTGGIAVRIAVRCFGKPTRPEAARVGSKVQTLGAVTASTSGTAFTPGTNTKGSWSATLGNLSGPSWWFQAGVLSSDTSITNNAYLIDVSVDTTSKYIVLRDMPYFTMDITELAGKCATGRGLPIFEAPSGIATFIRGGATAAPDSTMTGIAYAVQG